jgi:hypothetical protein
MAKSNLAQSCISPQEQTQGSTKGQFHHPTQAIPPEIYVSMREDDFEHLCAAMKSVQEISDLMELAAFSELGHEEICPFNSPRFITNAISLIFDQSNFNFCKCRKEMSKDEKAGVRNA